MKKIKFYFRAFFVITFSKEFKKFESDYLGKSPEIFFMDGERIFSEKEEFFMTVIKKCYNKKYLQMK